MSYTDIDLAVHRNSHIRCPPDNHIKVGDSFDDLSCIAAKLVQAAHVLECRQMFRMSYIDQKKRIVFCCQECSNVIRVEVR